MTSDKDDYLGIEEDFHAKDRKTSRKERKRASEQDRSKYKKTDQDQLKKRETFSAPKEEEGLLRGRILGIHPEGIIVDSNHSLYRCQLKGSLKKEKNRLKNLVAVGDFVRFEAKEYQTGVIVSVEERYSVLSRADNLLRRKEQLIAVNIDQAIITVSVVFPPLKPFLIDRYIIAAKKGNMDPIIVVNKMDLLHSSDPEVVSAVEDEAALLEACKEAYEQLHIPFLPVSTVTGEGIEELKMKMQGKASVFSGQSGVGKSSLINAVIGTDLRTGEIVGKTLKGSHTTTTTHMIPIEGGGFCIDTPGIKSFGLWDLSEDEIKLYFPEIAAKGKECKFPNCSHQIEPDCAVQTAVENDEISALRFASFCALMDTLKEEHRHR
jgi:ribosome biogenesis GTPase / thiamine phosphate phosphatase